MSKAEKLASLLNASGLIDSEDLASGSISSAKLADSSITNTKYAGPISVDGSGNATISGDTTITGNIDATKVTSDSATISGSITGGSIVSTGDITDTSGSVREFGPGDAGTPLISDTNYTIPSGSTGQCIRFDGNVVTVTVDGNNISRGEVITLVNQTSTTITINFQNWGNGARVGGINSNYNGVNPGPTLQAYGVCTLIAPSSTRVHITGNLTT